jgi:uncharacterized protein (DUF849 family)
MSAEPAAAAPAIVCVAITGSLPQKSDNPAVPITVAEQVESTREAREAGAATGQGGRTKRDQDIPT